MPLPALVIETKEWPTRCLAIATNLDVGALRAVPVVASDITRRFVLVRREPRVVVPYGCLSSGWGHVRRGGMSRSDKTPILAPEIFSAISRGILHRPVAPQGRTLCSDRGPGGRRLTGCFNSRHTVQGSSAFDSGATSPVRRRRVHRRDRARALFTRAGSPYSVAKATRSFVLEQA